MFFRNRNIGAPRILVIRRRYIGDLVLLAPLLRNLHLHWPDAVITVLADEGYAEILSLNPDCNRVLQIPRRGPRLLQRHLALLRDLRSARFTHVFDIDNTDRTTFLTRLTGAPFRAGFQSDRHAWRRRLAYTHLQVVPPAEYFSQPITSYYLSLLKPAGVPVLTHEVQLTVAQAEQAEAAKLLAEKTHSDAPVVLIHPGSRSPYRIWPVDRFARVADRIQRELGAKVVLIGGPSEQDLLREIFRLAETPVAVIDQPLPLALLAAVLAQARILLCHDSGPMHIAAAVGTRVVALYSSQNRIVWGPHGAGNVALQAALPCAKACVRPGECDPDNGYKSYCVRRITEDEVFAAVQTALSQPSRC